MPGIVGIVSQRPAAECSRLLEQMIGSMLHESFYTSGTHCLSQLGLYCGWIGFVDAPVAGKFCSPHDRGTVLVRSGEIEAGDANALSCYAADEEDFPAKLNGLFSGLLADERQKRICLFNDRYGFQRIYFHEAADAFYFASEAKALLRVLPHLREFDQEGLSDYLTFGCAIENRTLFRGISLLPGGSNWCWREGKLVKRTYFQPRNWESQTPLSEADFADEFANKVRETIPRYFASNGYGLGLALTAGLDSRLVVAARPRLAEPPACYTYDGPHGDTLDAQIAARVAAHVDWPHQTVRLGPDFFSSFGELADRTVFLSDGTFGTTGAHELFLSRAARALAPVRLTGVFGGEIFRGVSTFKPIGLHRALLEPTLQGRVDEKVQLNATQRTHPVSRAAFREIPWSIHGSVACCRSQLSFRTPYLDNDLVSLAYRIPESWRGSGRMFDAATRRLAPDLATIPTDMGMLGDGTSWSRLTRASLAKATFKLTYLTNDGMPKWMMPAEPLVRGVNAWVPLLRRHKYLTYRRWLRHDLASYLREAITEAGGRSSLWDRKTILTLADDHIAGRANFVQEISAVLTLDAVERQLLSSGANAPAEVLSYQLTT